MLFSLEAEEELRRKQLAVAIELQGLQLRAENGQMLKRDAELFVQPDGADAAVLVAAQRHLLSHIRAVATLESTSMGSVCVGGCSR